MGNILHNLPLLRLTLLNLRYLNTKSTMSPTERRIRQGHFLFRYRGVLPLLVLVPALVLCYTQPPQHHTWHLVTCWAISLLGMSLRIHIVGHTPKGTSGRNTGRQLAEKLNTTGMYSLVRHPLYLANFIIWLGLALYPQNPMLLLASFLFFYWVYRRIFLMEDAFLKVKHGVHWEKWAKRTSSLWPHVSRYLPSHYSFNWKKVIRKEKNGVLAVVLVFTLFEITRSLGLGYSPKEAISDNGVWIAVSAFLFCCYLLIKVLMKKTNWLK